MICNGRLILHFRSWAPRTDIWICNVGYTGMQGGWITSKCRWQKETLLRYFETNWRAPWKNRISSTSMKLRKSLVKPVTWQNISSCLVLSPEIIMHDAFNVILWTSADICIIVHDDLGWKNRTTRYILLRHWLYKWFLSAANVRRYMRRAWQSRVKELNNTL